MISCMSDEKQKIRFIICYFGEWPIWFDGFLLSCKYNPDINWLFFTDCKLPNNYPTNVKFIRCSIDFISRLASRKLQYNLNFKLAKPYKLCDLRPAYGLVFEDYIKGYDFWGFSDIDIIFGNIKNYITNAMLKDYDIISSRKKNISGHFSLFKNNQKVKSIFRKMPNFENYLTQLKHHCLDEIALTAYLKENIRTYKVGWNEWLVNFPSEISEKRKLPSLLNSDDGPWYWKHGKLSIGSEEVMYLHFQSWKNSIKNINFKYKDQVESFYINNIEMICYNKNT